MRTNLSVNLNKVALLRNQRDVGYPSVVEMAKIVIAAGAHGITVHPRPDERHIRKTDVLELRTMLDADRAALDIEFNIEGYPTAEFLELVHGVVPDQVTLVPDAPDQRTSDHGWDLDARLDTLKPIVEDLRGGGIRVSLFVDPEPEAMTLARDTGTDRVELYTEPYASAHAAGRYDAVLEQYVKTAEAAIECTLGINAGHDLNLENLPEFKAAVPELAEVSIGHAITADALKMGFPAAVTAYLDAIK